MPINYPNLIGLGLNNNNLRFIGDLPDMPLLEHLSLRDNLMGDLGGIDRFPQPDADPRDPTVIIHPTQDGCSAKA